jgi:RNA polymerase sigma-70 factor (ECF subfamily)
MSEASEHAARCLAAARAGSKDALGEALEACRGYLLLVADQELAPDLRAKGSASDLVQETFLEAQRDFGRFAGQSEDELLAWLRQMLVHNLLNFTRRFRATSKRKVGREVVLPPSSSSAAPVPGPSAPGPSPSAEAMEHERAEALERAMASLPEDYRRVILLRYQDEQTFQEIGRLMARSPNAARKLWLRAVERLQQEMDKPHER